MRAAADRRSSGSRASVTAITPNTFVSSVELTSAGEVLPAEHPLAGRPAVQLADLADEPLAGSLGQAHGRPVLREGSQLMQLVALCRAVAVVPESARAWLAREVVAVPVLDAPVIPLHVAWPEASTSRAVAAFVRAAAAVAARHAAAKARATARLSS
jgi:hypothetical protein